MPLTELIWSGSIADFTRVHPELDESLCADSQLQGWLQLYSYII